MNKNKLLGGFCAVNMLVLPQIVVKAQQSTAVNDKKTNIIFILADDMGYCDLACYGNKYIELLDSLQPLQKVVQASIL